jgi:hypothetical protein
MARVEGPLFSLEASGTVADTITYSHWKGRNYARTRVIPKNPRSAKQVGVRTLFAFCAAAWKSIATITQATWDDLAKSLEITPFDAYMRANLKRWQNFQGPSEENPAADASTPLTITTLTTTGGVGQVNISITPSGATNIWGLLILRDDAAITVPDWTQAIKILPANGANAVTFVDTPLAPGTYHYRAAAINIDGVIGTVKADQTAVVT